MHCKTSSLNGVYCQQKSSQGHAGGEPTKLPPDVFI